MNAEFFSPGDRKRLLSDLKEKFGVEKLNNYMFLESGKSKIRAFSGSMSKEEIQRLAKFARVEIVGLYFARDDPVSGLRLSVDATHVLKDNITKNIVELDDDQSIEWMRGKNIPFEIEKGLYIIKNKDDFLGSGFSNGTHLFNFVPRERQIKG